MAKNTSNKGIIMQGIGRALVKNVAVAPYEYSQIFLSKRLPRSAHADALYHLLQIYTTELEKEKFSIIKIQKILYFMLISFTEYIQEPNIPVELYSDMKKIKMLYDEVKETNEKLKNEEIEKAVNQIDEILIAIRPELTSEDISLAQKIKEKLDDALKESIEKDKEIQRLRDELERFSKEVRKDAIYREKYESSKKEITSLNEEIKKVEKNCRREILHKDESIQELDRTISTLEKDKAELELKLAIKKSKDNRDNRINEILFEIFSNAPLSPTAIIKELENRGLYVTLDELHNYIKNSNLDIVKQAYNNNQFSYGFSKKLIYNSDINFGVSFNINCIFISNLDLSLDSTDTYRLLDNIYNYCKDHNINYIITLGNIIKVNDDNITYSTIKEKEQIINEIIKNYPKDPSINNFILGGDNEILLNNYGYNIMNILNNERYDFYNIGSRSASLKINGGKIFVNMHSMAKVNADTFVNNFYNVKNFDNPYYLDIVGTDGISSVNMTNRIITVPPLMSNDKGCTIFQVEITMQNGDYKKFTISPIMNTELKPTSKLLLYK